MSTFKGFFYLEGMRLIRFYKALILVLICILLAVSIQDGKRNYHMTLENAKLFQETEAIRVKFYLDYTYYGWYGVSLMLVPGPCGVIAPGIYNELSANINSGERLTIQNQLKGRNLFADKNLFMDFSGLIILIGCLLSLVYGFEGMWNREYLMFLASLTNSTRVVISMLLARMLLIIGIFLFVAGYSLLLLLLNGIPMFTLNFLWFLVTAILIFALFFLLGALIGTIKYKVTGIIGLCALYFFFVFLLPLVITKSTQFKADNIQSSYKTELDNLKLVMNFEGKAFKEAGIYSETKDDEPSEKTKQVVKKILGNEIKIFRAREERTKNEILDRIKYYHGISSFFPISFYLSLCNEIGSKGYLNFIDFYSFSQKQKARFIDYYVQKKFFHRGKVTQVESFITGDENLFYSKSRLPLYFARGIGMTVFYILVLSLWVFRRFNKMLGRDRKPIMDFPIDILPGKLNLLMTGDTAIRYHPFYYFSGTSQTPPITVNGQDAREYGCVYLPAQENFPPIPSKALHLVFPMPKKSWRKYFRTKKDAQNTQFWEILLEYSKKTGKVLLLDEFFASLRPSEIEGIKKDIASQNIKSLYITKNEYLACSIADNLIFCSNDQSVEAVRMVKNQ